MKDLKATNAQLGNRLYVDHPKRSGSDTAIFFDAFFAVEKFFGKADEKDQEDQGKMTDKDGGAILKEILSSYGTQERQAVLNEAMQLSPHLGTGRPAAVQDNVRSFSLWPKIVS